MVLYNSNSNKAKAYLVIAAFVLVNAAVTAGVVFALVVICKIIFTDYTKEIWQFWTSFGCLAVGVFLYWLFNKLLLGAYDKYRFSVKIKGYGIAMCDCGYCYRSDDIQYSIDKNSVSSTIEKQGSTTTCTSKGNIRIECTCKKCGKVHNDNIYGVQLSPLSESVKQVRLTTNLNPTYKHKSASDFMSLENEVLKRYESDMLRATNKMTHYELLGYTTEIQ